MCSTRGRRAIVVLIVGAAVTVGAAARTTGPSACLGSDAKTQEVSADLISMFHMAAGDSTYTAFLSKLGLIPVPDTSVVLVLDSTICRRALGAYLKRDTLEPTKPTAVYVLRAGPRYVVTDTVSAGEFSGLHFVFDTAFVYKDRYYH